MVLTLIDVLQDPKRAGQVLEHELFGLRVDRVLEPSFGGVVLDITFAALPELRVAGYEQEQGRISIRTDGTVYAFPLGLERSWGHRECSPLGARFGHLAGELCLYYRRDSRALRWTWADGLEQYVTRVHRHLFFEEFRRREGYWPVEDVPHGDPVDGAHPVHTGFMRKEERRWTA